MAVAHAAATAETSGVPSLTLTTTFDGPGDGVREHGDNYYYNSTSTPSFRRSSLPVIHSPRLAQAEHSFVGDQHQLSPPTSPLIASASTTDLHDTNPILSPLQRRATVRQTRSSANMRFSMTAGTSPAPSPIGRRTSSRCSSPAMTIERKPVPSSQFGSLGRKNKIRPSSLAQSPTMAPGEGFPRLGTPTNTISRSPNLPFSANSTPALAQTPSWASLPQPPQPPQAPFLERPKTPPALLLEKVKTGFGSPVRRKNAPDRINTNFGDMGSKESGDESAMGMISFFSPISSDEEDDRTPMRLPKRVWTGEGLVGTQGTTRPGSKKSTILFSELSGGAGKDTVEGAKKEKKEKKEGREGKRRVSGFGAGHFRKFWGGKDEEPKSPGMPKSPGLPLVSPSAALPPPNPSFLNKAANRASSPSPFRRAGKKDKEEKKEKKDKKDKESKKDNKDNKDKEIVLPKGMSITPNSTFSGRVKISNPIPHPDLLQIFPSPTSPKFPPGVRPRGASMSLISSPISQHPGLYHTQSASSSTYSTRLSSDMHAPSMTSFSSNSTGNHRSSPLSPGGSKTTRPEDQTSSPANAINAHVTFPPSPPYTTREHNLRPHTYGHVRSVSAPSINVYAPRNSGYQYTPHGISNAGMYIVPAGTGWKFPPSVPPHQQHQSTEEVQAYFPGSAQDLLHTLHQSLATVENTYSYSMTNIAKEISFDERLAQELEVVEKRLRSQMEIIAGIKRQVEERRRRRESKLRREREAEAMASAAAKEPHSESERSYFSGSGSEAEEEADDEHEPEETEERNPSQVTSVMPDGFIGRRPLTNVDEEVGEFSDTIYSKLSSFTNNHHIPSATEDSAIDHHSMIPRLSAIKRTDTDITIASSSGTATVPTSTTTTPTHSAPPSRNNSSLLPKRTSLSSPRRRPVGSLARQTFGEEQRKHAMTELRTNIAPTPEGSRAPTPASAIPRYTPLQTQSPAAVGLGIMSPTYIPAPTPAGLQSSASSFSFESSDVEKTVTQGYHHLPLRATPSQQPSRETLDDDQESKENEDKVIDVLEQRFEEKKGMYYNQQSANTTSTSLNLYHTTTNSSSNTGPPSMMANTYQPQVEKPTSGHIHFPTPASTTNSRSNSRANTPIPFGPSGNGLISPPISPPTSSHGGRYYRAGGGGMEEVIRERAMSPEGMLVRSATFGDGLPAVLGSTSGHERKAVIEGVELMLI